MILTPLDPATLPRVLDGFAAGLPADSVAAATFARIAATRRFCPALKADLHAGRDKAIALARRLGIGCCDEDPAVAFSWDGLVIRTRSETSVVFHEVAHWQLAPPGRRILPDFGLGAGPETGRVTEANAAACVDAATREEEESLASLLGILWEVAHDEPALLAFAEQNWLEMYDRPGTPAHFMRCLAALETRGLIDGAGRPVIPASGAQRVMAI
jgi:hypothetical protein